MKVSAQKRAVIRTEERNSEIYKEFSQNFIEKIANTKIEWDDGAERIQLLEQIVHSMNSDITLSNLKYV